MEASAERLMGLTDRSIAGFMENKLAEEIKRLHNPNSAKTIQLFNDYAGINLYDAWSWNNFDPKTASYRTKA